MAFEDTHYLQPENILRKDGLVVVHTLIGSDAATAGNYGTFFIAPFACTVRKVRAVWQTASTSGTLQIERLQGTTAAGSGDNILDSTIDLSGTANTVTELNPDDMTAERALDAGDRLALVDGGTLTNQNTLCVTVYLAYRGNGDYR